MNGRLFTFHLPRKSYGLQRMGSSSRAMRTIANCITSEKKSYQVVLVASITVEVLQKAWHRSDGTMIGRWKKGTESNQLSATMNMPTNLSSRQVANNRTSSFPPAPSPTDLCTVGNLMPSKVPLLRTTSCLEYFHIFFVGLECHRRDSSQQDYWKLLLQHAL